MFSEGYIQLSEKYKQNFDVSIEGRLLPMLYQCICLLPMLYQYIVYIN